jgi:hypothetical protein
MPPGPGTLAPGSYEFPFAFTTPPKLPGTMRQDTMDVRAFIEYKISAKVDQVRVNPTSSDLALA